MAAQNKSLSNSENKLTLEEYKKLLLLCPVPMAITKYETGMFVAVNVHFEKWTGYSQKELTGVKVSEINFYVDPDDRQRIVEKLIKDGSINNYEFWIYNKDKKKIYFMFNAELAEIENEKYIISTSVDLTEKKEFEIKLKESESKYRNLFNNATDSIYLWLVNDEFKVEKLLEVNESACAITGYSREELLKMMPWELNAVESKELSLSATKQIIDTGSAKFEIILQRKNGDKLNVEVNSHLFELNNKKVILSIMRDVTLRKNIEDELRLTKFCVDNASVGIIRTGSDAKILGANNYICELLGYSEKELCEKYIYEIDPNFPRNVWRDHRKSLKQRGTDTFETIHVKKNGQSVPVQITNTYIEYRRSEFSFSFVQDITERKLSEQKIINSLREKEILLKEIHHRVKNNLQVVSSLLYLQSQQLKNPELMELFKVSQNRIRSIALIHEKLYQSYDLVFVDFAQYVNSLIIVLKESFNLEDELIDVHVESNNIRLDISKAIPCGLIINELITNSIKHAFKDKKKGIISIELKLEQNKYLLTVKDNGIGLPASLNLSEQKTLGLKIVENLVYQLNGKFTIEVNHGTQFNITFANDNTE
jgi:PAS domain S-box-containing protein